MSRKAPPVLSRTGISPHISGLRELGLVRNHKTPHMVPTSSSRTWTKNAGLSCFIEVYVHIYKVLPCKWSHMTTTAPSARWTSIITATRLRLKQGKCFAQGPRTRVQSWFVFKTNFWCLFSLHRTFGGPLLYQSKHTFILLCQQYRER